MIQKDNMVRIVVSITTLPSRLDGLRKVLDSLLRQRRLPDRIYLNIPYLTRKGHEYDSDKIRRIERMSSLITVNRCQDEGPITKLLPVLDLEIDPDTIIITFDDDNYVGPNVIRLFEEKSRLYPDSCLSFSGWCVGQFPFYYQLISDNVEDVEVDWLQGCHGILYRRKLVDPDQLRNFRTDLDVLERNDDHRISAYLTCPKISIGYSATRNFYSIGNGHLDSISGADGFTKEVMDLSWKFKQEGIYYHNSQSSDSVIFIPIVLIILILIAWFGCRPLFVPILLLILIIVGIWIWYRCENLRMRPYSK